MQTKLFIFENFHKKNKNVNNDASSYSSIELRFHYTNGQMTSEWDLPQNYTNVDKFIFSIALFF